MNVKFFILFILLMGVVFTIIPDAGADAPKYDFFMLVPKKVSVIVLIYHLMEHVAWIMVSYAMMMEIPKHRPFLNAFFIVQIGDVIDYFLTYNTEWFFIGMIPISYNTVSFLFIALVYFNESRWKLKSQ